LYFLIIHDALLLVYPNVRGNDLTIDIDPVVILVRHYRVDEVLRQQLLLKKLAPVGHVTMMSLLSLLLLQ